MGIRGLTKFINENCRSYLEEYHLSNTYIVLDGYNIASHLYKWHCKRNDCFGGDYDKYAKVVRDFFKLLETCGVCPIVIFDGGYENKKLRTIYKRFKNKIHIAKHLNSVTQGSVTMFPLFLRDLFVDIVLSLNVQALQCHLEADYEIACVAKALKCPVLSYDSDFYIFDVLYIPFSTFEMRAHKDKNSSSCYIQCQIYRIEKFLKSVGLNKKNLPLMATLLGNDYIKKSVFQQFYNELKLPRNKGRTGQQVKILGVIKWLQNESYDSAVMKILNKLKTADRKLVADQIKISTDTYLNYSSEVLKSFNLNIADQIEENNATFTFDSEKYLQSADGEEVEEGDSAVSVSEESDDESPTSDLETDSMSVDIPDWFKENFRKCQYPQSFMDVLCHNFYISTPQVEDYDNICSHTISFSILSAIQKILSPSSVHEGLTCIARTDRSARMSNLKLPLCNKTLPILSDIRLMDTEQAKSILFDILEISTDAVMCELLNVVPTNWQLYYIAIVYWIKHASPKVTPSHVYSLIICAFVLNKIDPAVGFYRSSSTFSTKFTKTINDFMNSSKNISNVSIEFKEAINNISYKECLLSFKELIDYFQMNQKMRSHLKLFDVRILDCFAQFQSCLFHIRFLNRLLNRPFYNFVVSEFYDGTFLFNMCVSLLKRNDIEAYLQQTLFKYCPNIFTCVKRLFELVYQVVPDAMGVANGKRRRRKKKKAYEVSQDSDVHIESGGDEIVDVNNRFTMLSLAK